MNVFVGHLYLTFFSIFGSAHEDKHTHTHSSNHNVADLPNDIWYEAFKATAIITVGGNCAILALIYFDITPTFLKRMVSFAIGGLLGDVFLHLIPHAIMSELAASTNHHSHEEVSHDAIHEHSHDHDAFNVIGIYVLAGILAFFVIEKLLQTINPGHSHSHSLSAEGNPKQVGKKGIQEDSFFVKLFSPGVILNLVTDFAHNFTDGLALAAAFRVGGGMGEAMTIAVTLHEIPHELGDFAVLLNNGMSKKSAFFLQFVSAVGAFLGCWFGLVFTPDQPGKVLAFTGGGFVYVATTGLLHDLITERTSLFESVLQTLFMSAGIYAMVLIGELEEQAGHDH